MARRAIEATLERVVRRHRFTVAVVFPLVGAALLVASAEGLVPPALQFHPLLVLFGTLVLRLPLIATFAPLVDSRTAVVLGLLIAFIYGIEFVGLATGLPYGEFAYAVPLGPMLMGVPLALPLFFLPLALDAYLLASLRWDAGATWIGRLAAGVAMLVALDLALDPGAVALGFWAFADGGAYYGVPLSNFAGWLLSGTVVVLGVDLATDRDRLAVRLRDCEFALDDLVSFALLWGVVNVVYGNAIPVLLALGLLIAIARTGRLSLALRPRAWPGGGPGR